MAVTSCPALAELLAKSGILAPGDPAVQAALDSTSDPREAAKRLIGEGRITRWQAQQLLAGRHQLFLGKYKLLDKLGEGGMGAVYKAEQTGMGRLVAVKVMSQDVLKDEAAAGRFHREIRSVSALNHPNIIAAIDADQQGNAHFLVMEYVAGRDLKAWIEEYGRLPVDWACECIRQAALGLQHAHEKGLVHRDIKPGNLLVVGTGTDNLPQIKILDMGLARFTSEAQCTQITKTGQVLGTIDYISPEQARDTKGADIRADVFSLGCTLFRMLTGEVPYTGRNPVEKLMARAMKDAPPIRSLAPELSPALERVIATMLARKPEDRYQTPQEVAEALAPFAAGTAGASEASSNLNLPATDQAETPGSTIQGEADQTLNVFLAGMAEGQSPAESLAAEPSPEVHGSRPPSSPALAGTKGPNLPVLVGGAATGVLVLIVAIVLLLGRGGNEEEPIAKTNRKSEKATVIVPPKPVPPVPAGDYALEMVRGQSRVNVPTLRLGPSQTVTLEGWITSHGTPGLNASLYAFDALNIRNTNGKWAAAAWTSKGTELLVGPRAEAGRATHVALVCDGKRMRLFVDGVLAGTKEFGDAAPTARLPDLNMGWDFSGVVDEVRISKSARYEGNFAVSSRLSADADTLALYHFDEGQGNELVDSSGNGHHGKVQNASWVKSTKPAAVDSPLPAAGGANYALEFDGKGAWVDIPSLRYEGDHPITIEMWATRAEAGTGMALMVGGVHIKSGGNNWQFVGLGGQGEKDCLAYAKDPPADKRQVHLAFVFNGSDCRAFVDGMSRGPSTPCKRIANRWNVATAMSAKEGWQVFQGRIDELRISKTARYAKDFIPLRPGERYAADGDTMALYHFDEGQGDVLKDSSASGHHGKIVGAKWVKTGEASAPVVPPVTPAATGPDYALEFDGNGRVELPASLKYDIAGPLTVEAYVNMKSAIFDSKRPFAWVFGGPPYLGLNANLTARNWQLQMAGSGGASDAHATLVADRRIHLAGVLVDKQLRLFIDGKRYGGKVKHDFLKTDTGACHLGRVFVGTIDKVRISNAARYDGDFTPAPRFEADRDTLALYQCDEGSGDVLTDSSGNGHDGKVLGAKWVKAAQAALPAVSEKPLSVTLDPAGTLAGNATDLVTIAWSPDGKVAATGGNLGQLTFWDVARQGMDHTFKAPEPGAIRQLSYSPDGKRLYSASTSGTIHEWNFDTRESTAKYEGTAFELSSDGAILVAGRAGSGSCTLIDTTTGKLGTTLKGDPPFALSQDGRRLAATSGSTILLHDLKSGGPPVELKSSQKNAQDLAFSPDGSSLAVGWLEEGLEIWSVDTPTPRAEPTKASPSGTTWLAWSPDGRVLVYGIPQGGILYFCNPRDGARLGFYNPKMGGITRGVFRRDGTQLLVCSNHREAKRFDFRVDPPADQTPGVPPPAKAPFDARQARAHQEAWAKHLDRSVETISPAGGKMALIPPGEFLMGSSDAEIERLLDAATKKGLPKGHLDRIRDLEGPQHRVVLTRPFWMATTETTVAQFRKFVEASGYVTEAEKYGFGNSWLRVANETVTPEMRTLSWKSRGTPDDWPVGEVTWNDAVEFCNWLSAQEKRQPAYRADPKLGWAPVPAADGYRLPSEAEWEYACRAGTTWWYFFGDDLKPLQAYASLGGQGPVRSKLPNGFGLYDLYGSVWEMCQDYDGKSYAESPLEDPPGPATGSARILRGGAANNTPMHLRSGYRGTVIQTYRNSAYGFRYVRGVAADAPR